ncbi:MAG: PleD family two-component system response regulator [Candidatus Methylomirabilales bacterium]
MPGEDRHSATLLLVDDQAFFLRYYSDVFARARYQVVTASNGEEALEKASSFRPDIVIVDLEMPKLDGIETCKRLKAGPSTGQIPVVILTASEDPKLNERAFQAGADATVAKSMDADRCLNIIEVVLKTSKSSDPTPLEA